MQMMWIFPLLLTLFMVAFRLVGVEYPYLLNATPVLSMFLYFGQELRKYSFIAFTGYVISDILLYAYQGWDYEFLHTLVSLSLFFFIYTFGSFGQLDMIGKTFVATTLYFVITSTLSWIINPVYGSGFINWINAIVIGDPQFPPAYLFYLKSLVGNLCFSMILILAHRYQYLKNEKNHTLHMPPQVVR